MARTPLHRRLLQALSLARRANLEAAGLPPPLVCSAPGWTRRRFVGAAGVAVPALTWGGGLPRPAPRREPPSTGHRVAVVGAGLAGLNAANRLMRAGIQIALYEASERVGGRVHTIRDALGDGLVTELGGEFINSDHADMIGLARDLGLKVYNRAESPATLSYPSAAFYFGGTRHTQAELAHLLRPLAAQIAADAVLLDRDPGTYLDALDRLSAADYLDRHVDKVPDPLVRTLIEATVRTEYGVEPEQSSALQLLANLPTVNGQAVEILGASDEAYAIQGGNSLVAAGLADALGDRVHLGRQLVSVRAPVGERVELRFKDGLVVDVDQAILAFPFKILRQVEIQGDLSRILRRAIAELDPGRNEKLLASFARRAWHADGGFAVEAWTDLGFAEVWDATLDPSGDRAGRTDGVLSFFQGGDEVPVAGQERDAQARGQTLVERLDRPVPGLRAAASGRYVASDWTASPYSQGGYTNHKPGQTSAFAALRWSDSDDTAGRQEVRAGALIFAGEHLSQDYMGYMNGAAQTGRLAADSVLRYAAAGRHG